MRKAFPPRARARDIGVAVALRSHVYTCTRNHRAAVLYTARVHLSAGIKPRYDLLASARGPASICHGDATHRYRLARPRNYPRRARILQRTPVIYRRGSPSRHTPPRTRGVPPRPSPFLPHMPLVNFFSGPSLGFPRGTIALIFMPLLSFLSSPLLSVGAVNVVPLPPRYLLSRESGFSSMTVTSALRNVFTVYFLCPPCAVLLPSPPPLRVSCNAA